MPKFILHACLIMHLFICASCAIITSKFNSEENLGESIRLSKDIDLEGKDFIIPKKVKVEMRGHTIKNGRIIARAEACFEKGDFHNVSIVSSNSIELLGCSINNPKRRVFLYCPDEARDNKISVIVKQCSFKNIGNEVFQDGSTISALYLQRVSSVMITGCSFSNIGNSNASNVVAVLIGSSGLKKGNTVVNNDICIRESMFSSINKKESSAHDLGEGHFISVLASDNVRIEKNVFEDNNLRGFDSEVIYTKSDNVMISHNTIVSNCGGEGIIVCKPFQVGEKAGLCHANIIYNHIVGESFSSITHYGVGLIANNYIVNSRTGFLISVQKYSEVVEEPDTLYIRHNTMASSNDASKINYTGNCRSVFYSNTASSKQQYVNVLFEENDISISNSLSGCIFNIRNASNISWVIRSNTINVLDKSIPLVFFQCDSHFPRKKVSCAVINNQLINVSKAVIIPDTTNSIEDSLFIEIGSKDAKSCEILDQTVRKSRKNVFVIHNEK